MDTLTLPHGTAPLPIATPYFPNRLHAVVWRNWDLIDLSKLSQALRGTPEQISAIAFSMGLPPQRSIPQGDLRRNYMTVLRRNWHLLPYEQLCQLMDWDEATMQFFLNEDDFMWIKLGGYKPQCQPVYYSPQDETAANRAKEIRFCIEDRLGETLQKPFEPLFGFIERFGKAEVKAAPSADGGVQIRMLYPYFLRYGDPLKGEGVNDIPEGYLAEIASSGINAIWIHVVLNKLSPWELAPELSLGWQERLGNLNMLVERCRAYGIEVFLYLNEPRSMTKAFFERHPQLRGVEETPSRAKYSPDLVALCTSTPEVQAFLTNSVRHIFENVPGLGGVMAITFSENLTNCYSREYEKNECPRCAKRGPEVINAEVCTLLERGMRLAGSDGKFLYYAWSTPEAWVPGVIARVPKKTWVLCVSEWGTPFTRGDYSGTVNEYSISVVGPSEQSRQLWALARQRGLKTVAKVPAANTWEISSIPYIPALRSAAQHLSNVAKDGIDGLMVGWTCGGSPSPNLELVAEFVRSPGQSAESAMLAVAERRFGPTVARDIVEAWDLMSEAFEEFPFDISVCYAGPQSLGPANPLFLEPTGFKATTVTYPFDDLEAWRGPYTPEALLNQFEKLARLWKRGVGVLNTLRCTHPSEAIEDEWRIAEAAWIHFQSTVNQVRFILVRQSDRATASAILQDEMNLALQLLDLVAQDSRIGFEATNQYGYTRFDLAEKILNCEDLLLKLRAQS